jgi:hypothetical protein
MKRMNAVWGAVSAAMLLSGAAMASGTAPIKCPVGTKLSSMPDKGGMMVFHCGTKEHRMDGPYASRNARGVVIEQGQYVKSHRSGRWTFFNEQGQKTGEVDFLNGDYHGEKRHFHENGQMKELAVFVKGKQQGPTRTFDLQGKPVVAPNSTATAAK